MEEADVLSIVLGKAEGTWYSWGIPKGAPHHIPHTTTSFPEKKKQKLINKGHYERDNMYG